MLDIGWQEFTLVAFILLIIVGPKDLPKVLRSITSFIRKIKSMASQFHSGIDDLANEAEISDLRKEMVKAAKDLDFIEAAKLRDLIERYKKSG